MVLPPPTGEQDVALETWARGASQAVTAAAGSGKSTLLLHAVRRAPPGAQVVILSYNRPLATEMTAKLERLERAGLMPQGATARAFTFHGLCTHLFALTPDDTTMEDVLDRVERGDMRPACAFAPTHVCVDEVQDMRALHHRLLRAVLPGGCVHLLVGDANQLLYDFERPPATTAFMETPWLFFAAEEWRASRLSVSFRLTPPVAALVNAIAAQGGLAPLEAGNASDDPPPARVISCSVWQWAQTLTPLLLQAISEEGCPSRVGVLVRSVRTSQPLLALVNSLAAHNVAVYVHSCDGADARVRERKICVSTWHGSKGLQWPRTFVLDVDASSEARPLHVALTRSQSRLVVVNDARAPHPGLLRALGRVGCVGCVVADAATEQLAARVDSLPPAAPYGGATGPRDLTRFAPRGGAAHELHRMIVDVGGVPPGATTQPPEQVVRVDGVWEDVTDVFVDAVLIDAERRRTGRCRRLEEMHAPLRASRRERDDAVLRGDRRRLVDPRLRDRDLLPSLARHALATFGHRDNEASASEQAMRAAAGASAFAGFHHRANRLLSCTWWDDALFALSAALLHDALCAECEFDVLVTRPPATAEERPLYARVHARGARCVYRVTFADRITAAERVLAALPLALDPSLAHAVLLNLRTGEWQRLVLSDRAAFLRTVQGAT